MTRSPERTTPDPPAGLEAENDQVSTLEAAQAGEPSAEPAVSSDGGAEGPAATRSRVTAVEWLALTLATALAGGWVFFDLGKDAIWIDEATTWGTASQHGATLWYWLWHDGGNMSGYYALMHVWVGLFGSGTVVLRLPAAIAYMAIVPCAFFLMRRLFDRRSAIFSAFAVPTSVELVQWGQQARGYELGALGVTAGALALAVAVQDRKRWAWAAFVACSVLASYMVLLASLIVVAQIASLLLVPRRQLEARRAAVAVGAVVACWIPLAVAVLRRGSGQLDWIARPNFDAYLYLGRFLMSSPGSAVIAWIVTGACLVGAGVVGYRLARHGRSLDAWAPGLLVAWVVLPIGVLFLVSVVQPVWADRYLVAITPAASMLAALGCSRLRPAPLAWAAAVALVVLRGTQVPPGYGNSLEDWPGATSFVASQVERGDCVAFFVADGFTAFAYYEQQLPSPATAVPDPVLPLASYAAATPFVLDPATIPAARVPVIEAQCPRIWVVETHQTGLPAGPGVPKYQVFKYHANQEFFSELAEGYHPLNGYPFKGVFVALYVRNRGVG